MVETLWTMREEEGRAAGTERAATGPAPGPDVGAQVVALNSENVRAGWAEFLARYQWDVFATLTYAGNVWAEEKVLRNFRTWLHKWQERTAIERGLCKIRTKERRDGYGRVTVTHVHRSGAWSNNIRKGRGHPVWVLGVEPHKSGRLHAHAIIKWSNLLPNLERRLGWHLWHEPRAKSGFGFGVARIEPPQSQGDVATYVSKYVVKGGDLYLSPSFDAARLVAV